MVWGSECPGVHVYIDVEGAMVSLMIDACLFYIVIQFKGGYMSNCCAIVVYVFSMFLTYEMSPVFSEVLGF